jgi:hypothetical protein
MEFNSYLMENTESPSQRYTYQWTFSEIAALFSETYEALKYKLWTKRRVFILTYVMNTVRMYFNSLNWH